MLTLWTTLALAQTCPELDERVETAWALFDDAELADAKTAIAEAYDALACQPDVVETQQLLALYRLDGLVSLSLDDRKGATYATLRAVAADHVSGAPPDEYGPDLAEQYDTWAARLGQHVITVRVAGAGTVWVDGHELNATSLVEVVEGEHLIQVRAGGTLRSEVLELADHHIVDTGVAGPGPVPLPAPQPAPVTVPTPTPEPTPAPLPQPAPAPIAVDDAPGRRHPAGLFIGGIIAGGAGGGALGWAYVRERGFLGHTYPADSYGGCTREMACYADSREQVIRRDALQINLAYGVGYGLCAVGAGLFTAGAVGVKARPTGLDLTWTF